MQSVGPGIAREAIRVQAWSIDARESIQTVGEDLVHPNRRDDHAAFESLYRMHSGRLYALCRRLTGDPARSEDLVHEVFIRAWERRDDERLWERVEGWLCRAAINVALTDVRTRTRRNRRETPSGERGGWSANSTEPGPAVGMDLERAIAALPEGARRVFVLHDVEGFRHREIAGLVGISPGTSKAQLHRARKLLRDTLRGS